MLGENMNKTYNHWKQLNSKFISGEEVCVMKKERVVNISNYFSIKGNFLIMDEKVGVQKDIGTKIEVQEDKNSFRVKPSKNIVAFITQRNLSNIKEHLPSQ